MSATTAQRLIPNAKLAETLGVTTRTLHTWERRGIIPPAVKVAGRKYHDASTRPRPDDASAPSSRNP